ncbi:MAG: OsmC family protein [Halomonas sp.]|uniref:OsmC family protein n=1 Tax=Halomonas sp. TaxID=1486246 RepID=UPI003F8E5B39
MQGLPHNYLVSASGSSQGEVTVISDGLPSISTTPPPQFGGPEGYWSPETLMMAAVVNCYVLSFRAVARASKLEWKHLNCDVDGLLDKVDGVSSFTRLVIRPHLTLEDEDQRQRAERCLEKAGSICLITNSMKSEKVVESQIEVVAKG